MSRNAEGIKKLAEVNEGINEAFGGEINRLAAQGKIADALEKFGCACTPEVTEMIMVAFEAGRRSGRRELKSEIGRMTDW